MKSLTAAQQTYILSFLDKKQSAHKISFITGIHTGIHTSTISRLCSKHYSTLSKSKGGHPSKLSSSNIYCVIWLITSQKAEIVAEVTKRLEDITNQPLSSKTVKRGLKEAGIKAVVKKKRPLLSKKHRRNHLDFALAHKNWTLDD